MKCIKTTEAVGHVLCHDITRIVKDVVKDTAFRKGHIVEEKDIPVLLSLGKDNLYVWEKDENTLHENEAAQILCDVCINDNMHPSDVKEGKIELIADCDGVFQVDVKRLDAINEIDEIMIATRHTNFPVKKGDRLLGTRVIPLVIAKEKMEQVKKTAGETPLVSLTPYKKKTVGIVTTGNEVMEKITKAILELKEKGAEMIVCTGGMSVDPDDKTPGAIKATGARIVSYGAPVLPGAMFLLSYLEDGTPVMGLPGCVMYAKATVFDLVLPRIAAGIEVTKKDLAHMGNGGFCLGCKECHYPNCSFGKGV